MFVPTLFTRISSFPWKCWPASSINLTLSWPREQSATHPCTSIPLSFQAAMASFKSDSVRAQVNTEAPREASSSTQAAPIPLVPPVTTAHFPSSVQRARSRLGGISDESTLRCRVRGSVHSVGSRSGKGGEQISSTGPGFVTKFRSTIMPRRDFVRGWLAKSNTSCNRDKDGRPKDIRREAIHLHSTMWSCRARWLSCEEYPLLWFRGALERFRRRERTAPLGNHTRCVSSSPIANLRTSMLRWRENRSTCSKKPLWTKHESRVVHRHDSSRST